MKSYPLSCCVWLVFLYSTTYADSRVAVSAAAEDAYTQIKYANEAAPKTETYVVMRGRYFEGATVDRSIDKMPFKQILSYLTPKLAKQQYLPAKSVDRADLMLVVHWGVTNPRVGTLEMMARSSAVSDTSNTAAGIVKAEVAQQARDAGVSVSSYVPEAYSMGALMSATTNETNQQMWMDELDQLTDEVTADKTNRNIAQLLGYTDALRKLKRSLSTLEEETTLQYDMGKERYFIILRAYAMHPSKKEKPPRPVWTLNLNISSPGNNFRTAMEHMSTASINFVGRSTDGIATVKPKQFEGKVELGETIILEQVK